MVCQIHYKDLERKSNKRLQLDVLEKNVAFFGV